MRNYKQGFYTPKHPEKYLGNPNGIVYRSSWEFKMNTWLDNNKQVLSWASEEFAIPYISPKDNRTHRYYVDYKATIVNNSGVVTTYLIEVKPEGQTVPPKMRKKNKSYLNEVMTYGVNSAKWRAAEQYALDRNMKFILITERDLNL